MTLRDCEVERRRIGEGEGGIKRQRSDLIKDVRGL